MRTGRPRTLTDEELRERERRWIADYRAKLRAAKDPRVKKLLHPEVTNRRKARGGRRTAELIRQGFINIPVPYKVGMPNYGGRPPKENPLT